jgi:hypothetical protein
MTGNAQLPGTSLVTFDSIPLEHMPRSRISAMPRPKGAQAAADVAEVLHWVIEMTVFSWA